MEQELAFYKLDAKFEHLGMLPLPEGVEVWQARKVLWPKRCLCLQSFSKVTVSDSFLNFPLKFGDGEEDESPYIGKARFKPNKFARKTDIMSGEQHAQMTTLHSRPSDKYDDQNKQVQQEIHDALVQDLEDKERAIKQGLYFKPDRHVDSSINANPGNWICTGFYILKLLSYTATVSPTF